jgi:hypothetical protein
MTELNGKTDIIMNEGVVASKYLDFLAADLLKAIILDGGYKNTTKINCLVNRFDIKSGIATNTGINTGILFDTGKMTISGGGKIDLRTKKLDMKIKPQPKDASLISLAVPIDNGGTLKSPTALPSPVSVLKGIALGSVGILALTGSKGSGDKNPCVAALEQDTTGKQPAPQKAPAEPKSSNPVKSVTEGIGRSLKSLFGGK